MLRMEFLNKNGKYDKSKLPSIYGYTNNKDIKFSYIKGLYIDKFRSMSGRYLKLGKYITLVTGKNGTMKSSLLGLIAHPFSSPNNAKDMYGNELKTSYSDVFRLSLDKDLDEYIYYVDAITEKEEEILEPVRIYRRESEERHSVTVGDGNRKGEGNFALNASYINLQRLCPIIETNAHKVDIELSQYDEKWIAHSYEAILQCTACSQSETISDDKRKNTLAPSESYYDFNSISSGEDNLGYILCKMLAFEKNKREGTFLQGLLCIDEIEASLHPSAQAFFLEFLIKWSKKHHVQVVVTTHSLYLIDYCLGLQKDAYTSEEIVINDISTRQVGSDHNYHIKINPDFKEIRKELTYDEDKFSLYKVNLICEDKVAKNALRKIIKKRNILNNVEFIYDISGIEGSSWKSLISLAKNGKKLLEDSIIILDPDVPQEAIDKLGRGIREYVIKIPDPDGLLLSMETRIVRFLMLLDGSSEFYSDTEKNAIIANFAKYDIYASDINGDAHSEITLKTKKIKAWKDSNTDLYNRGLTKYIKDNSSLFKNFVDELAELINKRRAAKALPPLRIKYNSR